MTDVRKCIYTGEKATAKDNVVPKRVLTDKHTWVNNAPVNEDYKNEKKDRLPTETEMELHRLFHKCELAKLEVQYYEARIKELQANRQVSKRRIPNAASQSKSNKVKKDKEIKQAIVEKEIIEETKDSIDKIVEERKKVLW